MKQRIAFVVILSLALSLRADEPGTQSGDIDQSSFTVKLSDGLTLQVIGLCDHPSAGQTWWKPDGSELADRPYDNAEKWVDSDLGMVRELAMRTSGNSDDTVEIDIDKSRSRSSTIGMKDGKATDISANATDFPKDTASTKITFTLATGKWETQASTQHGRNITTTDKGSVAFGGVYERPAGGVISVVRDQSKLDCRLVAVDKDEQEHVARRSFLTSVKQVYFEEYDFDVQPDKIKEYRLQTRPYDTEVEFSNVSLIGGEKTDVKIEIRAAKR